MKKIFVLLTSIMLLAGCAETMALLGPASSLLGGGNVVQSSISSAASYGIKKTTGKSPMQHALAYAEEKNPNKNKDKCLSFLKETDSEACYIAKKQISSVKKSASKKIKNIINQSKPKKVIVRKNKSKIEKVKKNKNKIETVKKIKSKIVTVKKIKTEQEPQLRSAKSMLIQSATSKKQVAHLKVSIKKNYKNNNLSK
jgi:hypothetical protein|tara:strand:- start:421 stop:1014 length:594 start_codon:yes stop_codon:yes gene_type:complete